MKTGLEDKVALVTGAGGTMGRAVVDALRAEGCRVAMVDLAVASMEALSARHGEAVLALACDISQPESVRAAHEQVRQRFGEVDILVNNAGGPPPGDFRDWSRDAWIQALDANMLTPIELMKATVDAMAGRGYGRVVNITSGAVKAPIGVLGLSNGARSGLTGFVAGLARSNLAAKNVTINGLLPGAFDTDRLRTTVRAGAQKAGQDADAAWDTRRKAIPAQRFGTAEEFGAFCAFLCSRQAGYLTGQNILLDGGAYPGTF